MTAPETPPAPEAPPASLSPVPAAAGAAGAGAGGAGDAGRAGRPKAKVFVRWVLGFILAGCVVGTASGIALAVVFKSFKIPASSMWPALAAGDHVFVNKLEKDPERGALVVFELPENRRTSFVKRVIAMPGDELTFARGVPSINGWPVPRCNVGPGWYHDTADGGAKHEGMLAVEFLGNTSYLVFDDAAAPDPETQGPYRVAAGEYFVLGDNRRNSHDSRTWFGGQGGGVPLGNTVGRVHGHTGPVLRKDVEGLAALGPALEACLAKRPKETTPPPPAHK